MNPSDSAWSTRPGSAGWWLQKGSPHPRQRRVRRLSVDALTEAALRLLHEHGSEALTMRRVAEALGCSQASLYRHVRSRDELTAIVADEAIRRGLQPPPHGLDWRAETEWSTRAFRAFLLDHPAVAPLIGGAARLGPWALRGVEHTVQTFIGAGLSLREAMAASGAIATFVIGSAQLTLGLNTDDRAERQAREALYLRLDPSSHPLLTGHAADAASVGSDEEFEFGLTAMLDGIAAAIRRAGTDERPT